MRHIYIILIVGLLFSSCSNDEKVIDSTIKDYKILGTNQSGKDLVLYDVNANKTISSSIYSDANGSMADAVISEIQYFKGMLYLIKKENKSIEIIDAESFKSKTTIDFSEETDVPQKIAFHPEATSAYLMFEKSDFIYLIDLTTSAKVKKIEMPAIVSDIEVSGRQIYVSCSEAKAVAVIDSRTQAVSGYIETLEYPVFLSISPDASRLNVVARAESGSDEMYFYVYDLISYAKLKENKHTNSNIGINPETGENDFFNVGDMSVSGEGGIFFPVAGEYVFSIREKAGYYSRKILLKDIEFTYYSYSFDELIYNTDIKKCTFLYADPEHGSIIGSEIEIPNLYYPFIFIN